MWPHFSLIPTCETLSLQILPLTHRPSQVLPPGAPPIQLLPALLPGAPRAPHAVSPTHCSPYTHLDARTVTPIPTSVHALQPLYTPQCTQCVEHIATLNAHTASLTYCLPYTHLCAHCIPYRNSQCIRCIPHTLHSLCTSLVQTLQSLYTAAPIKL